MNIEQALEIFSKNFVLPEFRERFIHEALKKPRKLHERICHRPTEIFLDQYRDKTAPFSPDSSCLVIGSAAGLKESTWLEEAKYIGFGGILIIDASGRKFYAESEGSPRVHSWAGVC